MYLQNGYLEYKLLPYTKAINLQSSHVYLNSQSLHVSILSFVKNQYLSKELFVNNFLSECSLTFPIIRFLAPMQGITSPLHFIAATSNQQLFPNFLLKKLLISVSSKAALVLYLKLKYLSVEIFIF